MIEPELAHSSTTTRGYFKVEPGADHPPAQVLLEVPRDPLVRCHCPLNCTQPEIMAPVVDVISGILHLLQENLQFEKVTGRLWEVQYSPNFASSKEFPRVASGNSLPSRRVGKI